MRPDFLLSIEEYLSPRCAVIFYFPVAYSYFEDEEWLPGMPGAGNLRGVFWRRFFIEFPGNGVLYGPRKACCL